MPNAITHLLSREYGVSLPRSLRSEFRRLAQATASMTRCKLTSEQIRDLFRREYLPSDGIYLYGGHQLSSAGDRVNLKCLRLKLKYRGQGVLLHGQGHDPIDALVDALGLPFKVCSCERQLVRRGNETQMVCFVEITTVPFGTLSGVGIHQSTDTAALMAVLSAVNRALRQGVMDDAMVPAAEASEKNRVGCIRHDT